MTCRSRSGPCLASSPPSNYARKEHSKRQSATGCPDGVSINRGRQRAVRLTAADPRREFQLDWHATTILSVRKGDRVAIGGDGQVTLGTQVMKADAVKIRKLLDGQVLVGFAGSAADGFALLERFEGKLKDYPNNVPRAATELAKLWRTDRMLRQTGSRPDCRRFQARTPFDRLG